MRKKKYERENPVTKVENLFDLVKQLIDQYDKEKVLTWHNGQIPEDEVRLKIGGDHGGGSLKLMLQTASLQNPNSKENTSLLAMVNCKDSPTNLRRILSPFKQQIADLRAMAWRDKRIKLFLFGDCDFLLKLYGIGGAQSTHRCLFCTHQQQQKTDTEATELQSKEHHIANPQET